MERYDVNLTGISRKVARLTLGDLWVCFVLLPSRGGGMVRQESADAVVAAETGVAKG
jgi:hypothetical protein